MDELGHLITNFYQLEDDVAESLCFRYVTHVGQKRAKWWITIFGHDTIKNKTFRKTEGDEVHLTIQDVDLSCFLPAGAIVEREVNCNSAFML